MSKFFGFVVMMAVIFITASLFAENDAADVKVKIPFEDDGRKWELFSKEDLGGQTVLQYIPAGQNPDNWEEVLTVQYFTSDQITSDQLYQLFMQEIESQVGNGQFKKIIDQQAPNNVLAQWTLSGTTHDQSEWVRITNKNNLVAVIRYTYHSATPPEATMTKWKAILEKVQI